MGRRHIIVPNEYVVTEVSKRNEVVTVYRSKYSIVTTPYRPISLRRKRKPWQR